MITLDVISVNGNTALADATYPVYERNTLMGFANPLDTGQTILIYENESTSSVELLVDDTVANVVTALTGGDIDEHLGVTFKTKDGVAFAHTGLINLNRILYMFDKSSDAVLSVYSPTWQNPKEFITDDVSATIAAGGGDNVEWQSNAVIGVNGAVTAPVTIYANELFIHSQVDSAFIGNRQATAVAYVQVETLAIAAAGTGYTAADALTVATSAGNFVVLAATVGGGGEVTSLTISNAGSFATIPTDLTALAVTGGTGTGCTIDITDFEVDSIVTTDAGYGYRTATATITGGGGTGATATVTVANSALAVWTLTAPGNNFTSIPVVTISAPNATTQIEVAAPNKNGKSFVY